MSRHSSSRYVSRAAIGVLCVASVASPVQGQMQQAAPSIPDARPSPRLPMQDMRMGMLEGAVQSVDPGAGTLEVSTGPFGILHKTLEVTEGTRIEVEGRQATLAQIREGERVKAAYEVRESKTVATQIEVVAVPPDAMGGARR